MASGSRTLRQRWSDTFKKRVVAEASQPGVTVAQIAHRYDLYARRISNWKTKFGSGAVLMPVEVTPDDDRFPMSADRWPSCIEIDLPCGTRVRCHADANTELVADFIAAVRSKR
jgi:transposase-like protein